MACKEKGGFEAAVAAGLAPRWQISKVERDLTVTGLHRGDIYIYTHEYIYIYIYIYIYRGYTGSRDITPRTENQMERESNMTWKLGSYRGFAGFSLRGFPYILQSAT